MAFVPSRPGGGAAKALMPPVISVAVCVCRGSGGNIKSYESHKRNRKVGKNKTTVKRFQRELQSFYLVAALGFIVAI